MTVAGIHLVGSVPLADNQAVFATAARELAGQILRIPDGETGERSNWIRWQAAVFAATPGIELIPVEQPLFRLSGEVTPVFGNLGYADAALASFQVFKQMQADGILAPDLKFQVSLPTPLAPIQLYFVAEDRAAVEPLYEAALLAELADVLEQIPHGQLAIQWDTAVEFGVLEGVFPAFFDNPLTEILSRLVRLGNAVPESVELGYHLCYGDAGHQHFVEPEDAGFLVQVANGINASLARSIQWLHLPVPKSRDDEAYFAPLGELELAAEAQLFLGLVHHSDGVAGGMARATAAARVVSDFGIATECGFGRRPVDQVASLMQQHIELIEKITDA